MHIFFIKIIIKTAMIDKHEQLEKDMVTHILLADCVTENIINNKRKKKSNNIFKFTIDSIKKQSCRL